MKKLSFLILSLLVVTCLFLIFISKRLEVNVLNDTYELPSLKEQLIENKGDRPNEYLNYFKEISTKSGATKPGYQPNYRINALNSALENVNSNRSISAKTASIFQVTSRGPGNIGGRTRAIIVDPDDVTKNTWFAGSASGGIWKTVDAGMTWFNLTPNLPNLSTNALAMSASNHNVIYAGTGEIFASNLMFVRGDGIFKSVDRGVTWSQLTATGGDSNYNSVNGIVISPVDENILVVCTNSGIFKSVDGGINFIQTLNSFNKSVQDIVDDPSDFTILYAGIDGDGVYKSIDAGDTWVKSSNGIGDVGRIEIAVSSKNTNKVYASTYNSSDSTLVYTSADKGQNWVLFEDSNSSSNFLGEQGWYDNTIAVNPYNEDEVFVGGVYIGKLLFNGATVVKDPAFLGVDLENTQSFLDFVNFGATVFNGALEIGDGATPSTQFFSVEIRFGSGVTQKAHRFTVPPNGGTNNDGGAGIPASEYVYADYIDVPFEVWDVTNNRQLMVSFRDQENNGVFNLNLRDEVNDPNLLFAREYIFINNVPYSLIQDPNIAIDGGGHMFNNMYFFWPILSSGVWDPATLPLSTMRIKYESITVKQGDASIVSDPRGDFGGVNSNLHADHHNLTIIPVNATTGEFRILNGNDGGLGISNDKGNTWSQITDGYVTSQFYGADKKPGSDEYFGGMQDNGTWQSPSGVVASVTSHYTFEIGGDGFEVIWHSQNPDKMMGSIYNNRIYTSSSGGVIWADAQSGINTAEGPFITRLASSYTHPDVVFAVTASGVYKTTNFGDSWTLKPISFTDGWTYDNGGTPVITSQHDVEVSLSNDKIVWAGGGMDVYRKLFVSTDRGETFNAVNNFTDVNLGSISGLATHPFKDSTAYALFSFAGSPKILRTNDLGQTWVDISGFGTGSTSANGFPDVLVHSLLVLPNNPNTILVGTEIGLFESYDNGLTWAFSNSGLPAVSIWSMKVVDDQIVIGTHGRGIWTLKLADLLNSQSSILAANYVGNKQVALDIKLPVLYDSVHVIVDGLVTSKLINPISTSLTSLEITMNPSVTPSSEAYLMSYLNGVGYKSGTVEFTPDFTPFVESFNQNVDDRTILDAVVIISEEYDSLEIYLNDILVGTERTLQLGNLNLPMVVDQPGSFVLQVRGYHGNISYTSNIKTLSIRTILGVEVFTEKKFIVFPNPVKDILYYEIPKDINSISYTINIFNINGSLVKSTSYYRYITDPEITISDLQKGVYIIEFNCTQGSYLSKFIKQ